MTAALILHNPNCSTSRSAVEVAADLGCEVEIRQYLKQPLTEPELLELLDILEDAPSELVRRDKTFDELGLSESDIDTPAEVAALIAAHPRLMQRPVIRRGNRAIIGRPKDRVPGFLGASPA